MTQDKLSTLRAWEETAEFYCKDDTPISPDGVRGYIAGLEAQIAAANADKTAAIESERKRLVPVVLDFIWRKWGMDYDDVHGKFRDGRFAAEHLLEAMTE